MAKNTFFIRATVTGDQAGGLFQQSEIDLGSYTNLGSSKPEVLRIHNVLFRFQNLAGNIPAMAADNGSSLTWQLTTQTQTAPVTMEDDSFVSGGVGAYRNPDSTIMAPTQSTEETILAQDFEAGYVIAVPTLYFGIQQGSNWTQDAIAQVMLECTTEAMSKANAVSLAISQQ